MSLSTFDLFKVGIGPSSSHTIGPMKAARSFVQSLESNKLISKVARVRIELFGSLGLTGKGHGSIGAVILGLEGDSPETVDLDSMTARLLDIKENNVLSLLGSFPVPFDQSKDLKLHKRKTLPLHTNGMLFEAFNTDDETIFQNTYYSVGGGFIVDHSQSDSLSIEEHVTELPYSFACCDDLLSLCKENKLSISELMIENEKVWRSEDEIRHGIFGLWRVMDGCISRGCQSEGFLPGGLNVERRAANLYKQLRTNKNSFVDDSLGSLDWVTLYALAVNEENAAGGRVVTAPTNGAAGIIPAVLKYYIDHCEGADHDRIIDFFLTAAAIGILYKTNASISGAEVGCQGEVGSACSMAAGALTEVLGGTPEQVENAAEIAMEHNLGLTCDPIMGLVQIPCIERNAMSAIKAISAARLSLRGDGTHMVSLDKVILTMRETGKDMKEKYKETARGGLALNVLEVPVNIVEC